MRNILLSIIFGGAVLLGVFSLQPAVSAFDTKDQPCTAATAESAFCKSTEVSPTNLLTKITRVVTYIVGIASVIAIMVGGLMMILAAGDASKIARARTTILYALVGMVVAALAGTITVFVLDKIK